MRVDYRMTANDESGVTFEYLPNGDEGLAGVVRYAKDKSGVEVLKPSPADAKSGYYRHHVSASVLKMLDAGTFEESGTIIWG